MRLHVRMSIHFYRDTQYLLASYTFAVGITASALYSILDPIEKDTGLTLNDLNAGTGYMVGQNIDISTILIAEKLQFLLFGWGCLFWQPLALQYGKRPVYLISMLATTVSPKKLGREVSKIDDLIQAIAMWVPYTKTNGQWIASKLLQGFFGAPVESLCEISVTDIACLQHTRSRPQILILLVLYTRKGYLHGGL